MLFFTVAGIMENGTLALSGYDGNTWKNDAYVWSSLSSPPTQAINTVDYSKVDYPLLPGEFACGTKLFLSPSQMTPVTHETWGYPFNYDALYRYEPSGVSRIILAETSSSDYPAFTPSSLATLYTWHPVGAATSRHYQWLAASGESGIAMEEIVGLNIEVQYDMWYNPETWSDERIHSFRFTEQSRQKNQVLYPGGSSSTPVILDTDPITYSAFALGPHPTDSNDVWIAGKNAASRIALRLGTTESWVQLRADDNPSASVWYAKPSRAFGMFLCQDYSSYDVRVWRNGYTHDIRDLVGASAYDEYSSWEVHEMNKQGQILATALKPINPSKPANKSLRVLILLPVEVVDKDKKSVTKLKVGKMSETGVLTGTGASTTLDIDKDSDRFYIRVLGGAALGGISVKVSTTDNPDSAYNDNATQIDLQTEGNDAISKSLLLVSDDVDDDYAVDGIADDATGDRTHKVQLGGNFKIEEVKIGTGAWQTLGSKTPVPTLKKIACDVFVLKVGGTAVRTNAQVEKEMKIVQERLAQVGVRFDYTISEKDQPAGVDLSDGLTVAGADPAVWKKIASETKDLITGLGTVGAAKDVQIFYVNQVHAWGSSPRGAALADYWFDESEEDYINNVIVGSPHVFDPFNVAHELGHLLTDDGHHPNDTNLMMGNGTPTTNTVGASKRLDAAQETRIINSDLLINP